MMFFEIRFLHHRQRSQGLRDVNYIFNKNPLGRVGTGFCQPVFRDGA